MNSAGPQLSLAIQAEGTAVIIDHGNGTAAFDWQEMIPGQQIMADNGALRFVVGERAFCGAYDENGNMVARIVDGMAIQMVYNVENRKKFMQAGKLVSVTGGVNASFVYDGDGNRVQSTLNTNLVTVTIGNYYEY